MGKSPKKPETIAVEVQPDGAAVLRVPAWLSAKARAAVVGLLGLGGVGIWANVSKVSTVDDRIAAADRRLAGFIDDLNARFDRLEAAQYTRAEAELAHALLAKADEALKESVGGLVASERARVERDLRDARRGGRGR